MSYDLNTDVGKVRLMIQDTSNSPTFTDDEINAGFSIEAPVAIVGGRVTTTRPTVRRVAAFMFDILAGNPKRLGVHLKVLDIDVDVSKAASEYRTMAKQLRDVEDESGGFAITEIVTNADSFRDRILNELQREGGSYERR